MRCLKIEHEWVELILKGEKVWELRRTNTNIRGRIALGDTSTKTVVGYATLFNCAELTVSELKEYDCFHNANAFIDAYADGRRTLFVWVMLDPKREPNPYRYSFSTGSWCIADCNKS